MIASSKINRIETAGDTYSAEEVARRRDAALRRTLNTPPLPHKSIVSGRKKTADSKPKSARQ
jgi:hypothetical protein